VRTVRSVRGQVDDRTRQIAGKAQEAEFKQAASTLMTELTAPRRRSTRSATRARRTRSTTRSS
jgi:hypothetical protein